MFLEGDVQMLLLNVAMGHQSLVVVLIAHRTMQMLRPMGNVNVMVEKNFV